AGVLLDPGKVRDWSQGMLTLIVDEKRRMQAESASIERSKIFSVERMCNEIMEQYLKAIGD
ncbi:MAG: hypothetical protein ABIC40_01920, partial [bacterium]